MFQATTSPCRLHLTELWSPAICQKSPAVNPMGLRSLSLQRLMCWCCGPSKPKDCPKCEYLVGCCSYCATVIAMATDIPADPTAFMPTHYGVCLLYRSNPFQMDTTTAAEVS